MKPKIFLLTLFFALGAILVQARNLDTENSPLRKNDINGNVIHNLTKKPLGNVYVTAYSSVKKEKIVATDNNGNFSIADLKPGTYRFVFEKNGYKKVTREKIVIRPDETFQMNIEMFEADDFNFIPGTLNFIDF